MTREEIGDEVAKACGWTHRGSPGFADSGWKSWLNPRGEPTDRPDYFHSSDACLELKQHLITEDEMNDFVQQVFFLTYNPGSCNHYLDALFAPAGVQCRAFLKAKKIIPWEDPA